MDSHMELLTKSKMIEQLLSLYFSDVAIRMQQNFG